MSYVRYRTSSFSPIEWVFVTKQPTKERLGGDFAIHPALFERTGETYSAEINQQFIQFTVFGNLGISDYVCQAQVNSQPLDCEQIAYYSDPGIDYFVRLTGDLGLDKTQIIQLNEPHVRFAERLSSFRIFLFVLIPFGLFYGIWLSGKRILAWRTPLFQPTRTQAIMLLLPWGIGLLGWTLLRAMLEYAFS